MGCGASIAGHLNLEKSSLGRQVSLKAVFRCPVLLAKGSRQGRSEISFSFCACQWYVGRFFAPTNRGQAKDVRAGPGAMLNALFGASMTWLGKWETRDRAAERQVAGSGWPDRGGPQVERPEFEQLS